MSKKKSRYKKRKIISSIILIISISAMLFSGYKIIAWFEDNKKSKQIAEEISNAVVVIEHAKAGAEKQYEIDFNNLKSKNDETVGWIKVNGTDIEYPVVKTKDNDYYMNHSFDKSYNGAGWIFVDCETKLDGTDRNIVIFGHNRRDGSMFGTLKNILTEQWYSDEQNYIIPFVLETEECKYQVFSVYTIEAEDYYITTEFANDSEFEGFLNDIKQRSVKDFGVKITAKDKILTLSTCADNNKYRVVLHAKKIANR
ncbi:MAG: class B sortase [Clostridia bacterium]|nr:class B sortase [Clostridia bacterium]